MHNQKIRTVLSFGCFFTLFLFTKYLEAQEQLVDTDFKSEVQKPAYLERGPIVAIDEAHSNFHTSTGQYRPFAELLRSDGYNVISFSAKFDSGAFAGIDILIIANALPKDESDLYQSAFPEQECDILGDWVQSGGSLLLIADHAPFGDAAANLAQRFGVIMGKGWALDSIGTEGITTHLIFSRANGLLGTHPILSGRMSQEEVQVIQTFTGQSLSVPDGASALMAFSPSAREALTRDDVHAEDAAARNADGSGTFGSHSVPVFGNAQGIAMIFGKGRVVLLGEAGLLSAQVIRYPDGREIKFGMNVPGNDNQQFGLNVIHWLSGLLN